MLDFLADDLAAHGDDLKHLMLQIVTSRAYSLPSVGAEPNETKQFIFRGPLVRRLSAEQFIDTVWMNTAAGPTQAAGNFLNPAAAADGQPLTAKWIWSYAEASDAVPQPKEGITLRRTFDVVARPAKAWAVVTCDNEFTLFVNGRQLAVSKDWTQPVAVRLEGALKTGQNELKIVARNGGDSPNAAGLFFEARIGEGPGGANDRERRNLAVDCGSRKAACRQAGRRAPVAAGRAAGQSKFSARRHR